MKTIFKVLDWSRFLPYLITEILFLLLTYPGLEKISIHIDAGYASYIIASSAIVLAVHVGPRVHDLEICRKQGINGKENCPAII
ncbi:MAG: hypothetical protein ACLGG7_11690 [Bacteriovoracia bacterium]